MFKEIDMLSIDSIRTLSIDAIEKANSGHPGMPMGAAPMAYTLWTRYMNINPKNPEWFNRDRFVLSAGSLWSYPSSRRFCGGFGSIKRS